MLIRHRGWIGCQWKSKGGRLRSGVRPWCYLGPPSQQRGRRFLAFSCVLLVYPLHEECVHDLTLHNLQGFGQKEALEMGHEVG